MYLRRRRYFKGTSGRETRLERFRISGDARRVATQIRQVSRGVSTAVETHTLRNFCAQVACGELRLMSLQPPVLMHSSPATVLAGMVNCALGVCRPTYSSRLLGRSGLILLPLKAPSFYRHQSHLADDGKVPTSRGFLVQITIPLKEESVCSFVASNTCNTFYRLMQSHFPLPLSTLKT